jgi:catechol 2,3-dioxygenase-like lactoylglutathione lyase family enzyme
MQNISGKIVQIQETCNCIGVPAVRQLFCTFNIRINHQKYCVMTIKAANITIMIKDMERSISFYQSLGLTVTNRWENHYAQLAAPGVVIGLHPTSENNLTGSSGNTSIGFTTDNFEDAKILLDRLAVPVTTRDEEGGQFLHFNDPDGTALYFIKPKW